MLLNRCLLSMLLLGGGLPLAHGAEPAPYQSAVRTFADNVLRHGRDTYGPRRTPLLADALNVDTHEPAEWRLSEADAEKWRMPRSWIMSNLANQQILFRVFVGLTELTGDPRYKAAAVDATRYALEHLRHDSGLLYWGGHAHWDLVTDQPVGEGRPAGEAGKHELKCNYPYYELMWEIDPKATEKFVESFWFSHVMRWDILDMNRHGNYEPLPANVWDREYLGGPVPFAGKGLTFMNTGSDMFYAGALLHQFTKKDAPLVWAKRLARRYVEARDPRTGLGGDNYSTLDPDRMTQQFGAEFGDRFTEATVTSLYNTRYSRAAICQLKLSERLGKAGEEFKTWAVEDLTAWARHAYDPGDNAFWATLIDGTKLSPADIKRPGYVESRWLEKRPADGLHLWTYALAWKLTRDEAMWRMTRAIAKGMKLGDIGETPGAAPRLELQVASTDVDALFGLLELHAATKDGAFLALARRIGDNLLAKEFHNGWFVETRDHLFCKFDTVTPLALLHLEAAARGERARVPDYAAGRSYFHCSYEGKRTYDHRTIYTRLRESSPPAKPAG